MRSIVWRVRKQEKEINKMTTEQTLTEGKSPRLDAYFWAGALIWAGLIFAVDSLGYLPQIGQANTWSWIFLGAGALGLVLNLFSQTSENYAAPTTWDWGWSILFLVIGAAGFLSFNIPGWLFLIAIGAAILVSALRHRD
jgi:hypothetical protein